MLITKFGAEMVNVVKKTSIFLNGVNLKKVDNPVFNLYLTMVVIYLQITTVSQYL